MFHFGINKTNYPWTTCEIKKQTHFNQIHSNRILDLFIYLLYFDTNLLIFFCFIHFVFQRHRFGKNHQLTRPFFLTNRTEPNHKPIAFCKCIKEMRFFEAPPKLNQSVWRISKSQRVIHGSSIRVQDNRPDSALFSRFGSYFNAIIQLMIHLMSFHHIDCTFPYLHFTSLLDWIVAVQIWK